ncbi:MULTISPECIES: viperin family antiviral radical SAM protein [unclassified Psychromonas]|uniref:viperin family antiviral radical SAM protein n=1 Tax=unclassified Psychromonas TaxID=2614957 RepID=UPI0004291A3D|nr:MULTISPECIES: viperin family antiviral radical SAM protein [unclassified Psychromonas]
MTINNIKANKIKELVINWHITEACNYKCNYCFAKWGKPNELHRSLSAVDKLLSNLSEYFIRSDSSLKAKLKYDEVRINIAGGEPMMLGDTFLNILRLAKKKGFKTSVITNGHYLLNNKINLPENILDMVGISFDSQNYATRQLIGRADRKGNSLGADDLKVVLMELTRTQKGIKTKINTVVNIHNWQENFTELISEIKPDKWKVLHVMPYGSDELLISDEQFNSFIEKHRNESLSIYAESNLAMTESYLMIDPKGCFYQNVSNISGYKYSEAINDVGVEVALKQVNFNQAVFSARYFPIEASLCEI